MKLLLTSGGITNQSIAKALFDLTNKKPEDTNLVFIPTAANVEPGDKSWLINDLFNLKKLNFKSIEIIDIAAVDQEIWLPRFKQADVLCFGGGNTRYLMEQVNKSGLSNLLVDLLINKVYMGISAGSMILCPDLALKLTMWLYEEDAPKPNNVNCLNYVDFYFLPHLNSTHFKVRNDSFIREVAKDIKKKIYALDDNSALKFVDGKVEIISEGQWFTIN